jgi:hypothetical protein
MTERSMPVDRLRPLKAFVTSEERAEIARRAAMSGLTVSAYLRNVALGVRVESVRDQEAILALIKLNADQGRLGGLLKLWLSTRPGLGAPKTDIRQLLREIEEVQRRIRALIDAS